MAAPVAGPRPGAMERRLLDDLEEKFIDPTRQGLYQSQAESAAVWNLYSGRIGPGDTVTTYPQTKAQAVAAFLRHVNALVNPTVGGPNAFGAVAVDAGGFPGDLVADTVAAAVAQIREILPAPADAAAALGGAGAGAGAGSLTRLIQAAAAAAADVGAINSRVARLNTLLNALVATFPVPGAAALAPLSATELAMVAFIKNASAAGFHAARIASGAVTGGRRRRNRSNSLKNKRKSRKSRNSSNSRNSRNSRRNRTR